MLKRDGGWYSNDYECDDYRCAVKGYGWQQSSNSFIYRFQPAPSSNTTGAKLNSANSTQWYYHTYTDGMLIYHHWKYPVSDRNRDDQDIYTTRITKNGNEFKQVIVFKGYEREEKPRYVIEYHYKYEE
jgi:hypothetical protein